MRIPSAEIPILCFLVAFAVAPVVRAELIFGPYLQSHDAHTISVCSFVEDGDKASVTLSTMEGERTEIAADGFGPACAKLTGLSPGVEYGYELFVNGRRVTGEEPVAFVSQALMDHTVVIFGDTRSGDDSFDLSHRHVVRTITESVVPDAIIHTGDFVERGDDLALWRNFFSIEGKLLTAAPIYPAIGRSDQPPDLMQKIFPLISDPPWYSFDRGEMHFSVLKLWQAISQSDQEVTETGRQAQWLRNDLAEAKARGARYLFIVMHEPAIDIDGRQTRAASKVFMPIFEAFGVTAAFSGAHYFSHAVVNGIHYFTNGGGGAILDSRPPNEKAFRYFNAIYHFLFLEVGRTGARVSAVNVNGEEFYEVPLGAKQAGESGASAPTAVVSFIGGKQSVAIGAFHQPGAENVESLKTLFATLASRTESTLVVTFRSMDNAENRAVLSSLTDRLRPLPIVVVGKDMLFGSEDIDAFLEDKIREFASSSTGKGFGRERTIVLAVVAVSGSVLVFFLLAIHRRKRRLI